MANNYRQVFKTAIARIFRSNGTVVGAGFLIGDSYLITCAHVVTAALGLPTATQDLPTGVVEVDFPLVAPSNKVKSRVIFWRPVEPNQIGEDIAGLQLESFPEIEIQPVRLIATDEFWDHPFQIFGFPSQRDAGVWASGLLRDSLANGWLQIEDIKAPGYAVQPGFSGAPVWDERLQGVVGMAVAAERKREEAKAAFMIPVSLLKSVWAKLELAVDERALNTPSSSRQTLDFRQVQLTEKRKYWSVLVEKWKAAYNQLSFTLSQADAVSIQQHLKKLEQDVIEVEQEIQSLGDR